MVSVILGCMLLESIFKVILVKKFNYFAILTNVIVKIIGLQLVDKTLNILNCDTPIRQGDYTLKNKGTKIANEFWRNNPSIHLKPRNYYDSSLNCLDSPI